MDEYPKDWKEIIEVRKRTLTPKQKAKWKEPAKNSIQFAVRSMVEEQWIKEEMRSRAKIKNYRNLKKGDVIVAGAEYFDPFCKKWFPSKSIGKKVGTEGITNFRYRVPKHALANAFWKE